jgi:hypothetical protein
LPDQVDFTQHSHVAQRLHDWQGGLSPGIGRSS